MTRSIAGPRDSSRTISDDPRRMVLAGSAIAGLFFVGFLGWAALTPLDAGAYAPGTIVVAGNRQAVQHREGGVVTALKVQEGQVVTRGQPLVEVSDTDIKASERGLAGEVLTLLAQRARLVAERDGRGAFAAPPEFASLSPQDRSLANEAMSLQQLQFRARRQALETQRGVLGQRVLQLNEQAGGAERQLKANVDQQQLIREEYQGVKELADKGYAPKTRLLALKRAEASLEGENGAHRAQIARSSEAVGETRLQIMSLNRERAEEVAGQLRDIQVRLDDLQPKWGAVREQLARAVIRAPASGKVVGLSVFTVGGVISPGQTLMEIVPQDRDLVVEARVSTADADDLRLGQQTQVRFSSLHERNLPILSGVLTKLSADSFADEKSETRYFRAEVKVLPSEMAKITAIRGVQAGIQPGLPVEVIVPLRRRTALDYLVEPLVQTFWRAGREH
ncbi:HlyD family type I secretion periplasmic adaptor subunit [Caulobacter sp. CCNWLY153]|jgi:HlyD family secretion protein|uniref:Membrane fusion protein (MFP) family protein n=1 Tax=Caulobacter radicis TaxID=2172650 RepID=A0A2T9J1N8_9CAUL|nr:HlyD family type I secretion periplasmic adaptor subunit [Caulobacter radicis]PVM73993.1 HlyD family type I secretion periplasmic adaptor subunit [Caulobacter radicis]